MSMGSAKIDKYSIFKYCSYISSGIISYKNSCTYSGGKYSKVKVNTLHFTI
jgi:hypothetical protein